MVSQTREYEYTSQRDNVPKLGHAVPTGYTDRLSNYAKSTLNLWGCAQSALVKGGADGRFVCPPPPPTQLGVSQ